MLDKNALRAEIVRNGMTQKELASMLGISEKTFIRRMKIGVFGTDEVEIMISVLKLQDPQSIFFAKSVTLEVT